MKSISLYTFLMLFALSLTACKSSEMATDSMGDGMAASDKSAMEEMVDVVEENVVEQLLAKHFEARGGKDKIKAIQTMTWDAGMEMMGMSMPLKVQMKRPNKMRQDIDVTAMNAKVTTAYDGTTAWMINPMGGSTEAQAMPEEAANQMKENTPMDGSLMQYMDNGYAMTYEGIEMVKEKPAHKVKVQVSEERVVTVFLDEETLLEVKTEQPGTNPMTGAEGTMATYPSDYREVGGVLMAHKINAEFDGEPLQELILNSIEINQDIPDSVFQMPGMSGSMN